MNYRLAAIAVLGTLIGGAVAVAMLPGPRTQIAKVLPSTGQALVGGPFTLVDHTGKTVTDQDFRGRYMLIYFGFTYCPDVCPSGLQVIATALDQAGAKSDRVVPILVSIDPERDTPELLAQYVPSFHPRLVGLTGPPNQVAAMIRAYRVYAKKVEDPKSTAGYTYDHSSIAYLMDPQGRYVTHFNPTAGPDRIAERLRQLP